MSRQNSCEVGTVDPLDDEQIAYGPMVYDDAP